MKNEMHSYQAGLDQNWVTSGLLDFEFKKYVLLDYIQKCQKAFEQTRLYPPLSELCLHYKNLQDLQTALEQMEKSFPKEVIGLDLQQLQLMSQSTSIRNQEVETIQEIIDFALPTVKQAIADGKGIYEWIEQHLHIQPIGLLPLNKDAGYLFIHQNSHPDLFVYRFEQSIFVQHQENFRQLKMEYVAHTTIGIGHTLDQIKLELIANRPDLPQPATYECLCDVTVPLAETLFPIAKRAMLKHLASAA
jgi:hypothetical protein